MAAGEMCDSSRYISLTSSMMAAIEVLKCHRLSKSSVIFFSV